MLVPPVNSKEIPSLPEWVQANREKMIQEVALPAIRDACLGITFCAVTSFFVTTNAGLITLAILPVAVTVINIYFRTMHLFFNECGLEMPDLWDYISYAPALAFSCLDLATRQVLIHESGHYLAIELLFEKAHPSIEVFPLIGGITHWKSSRYLTDWGKSLGSENAKAVVAAAGTVATQLLNIPALVVGHYWGGQMGSYLQASAFISALGDATYALSALSSNPSSSSDFGRLKKYGIHPLIAATTAMLIPLAVKSVLLYLDQFREKSTTEEVC
ncbi:hypothetical protein [Simkania sp.]|uniref:hypothetical protein n=1 Tax=Simkania sp. TaxID=34094 RepID=UPI003B52DFA3